MDLLRPTYIEVNLDNINHNIKEIKKLIEDKTKLAIVLKANGYGHGAIEVCKNINKEIVDYICVATLSEALEIRYNNIDIPVLVMGYIPDEHLKTAIKNNITITIFSTKQAQIINNVSKDLKIIGKAHIKIDTGMGRIGFKIDEDTINKLKHILNLENLFIEGIFSHLALKDKKSDYEQFRKFKVIVEEIEKLKNIQIKHMCDSIGMVAYKDFHLDMVRVGASIYGYNSRSSNLRLKEAMTFKSKIIQTKDISKGEGIGYDYSYVALDDMTIGILPCGYGDGIPRCLSNKGYVFVNNIKCNIVGKICMDQMVIDISKLKNEDYEKDVILYGDKGPNLLEVANLCKTNRNEIISSVSRRVDRVYIKNSKIVKLYNYILGGNCYDISKEIK